MTNPQHKFRWYQYSLRSLFGKSYWNEAATSKDGRRNLSQMATEFPDSDLPWFKKSIMLMCRPSLAG